MNINNTVAFKTIITKEVTRFLRIWVQALLPPFITVSLYIIIFGNLIGPRIGDMAGFPYIQYIAPGLIMMSVITNSYSNVVSSFYGARFQRSIEELLVSPTPNSLILLGFVIGGVIRGLLVGLGVTIITLFFTHLNLHSVIITFSIVVLTATLFSLAGFTNAIFANSFDDIIIVPTFILTPLTYLGGVFYSITMLPPFWQHLSKLNPILYMVNTFREGILGVTDINTGFAFSIIILFIGILTWVNLYLLKKGVGLRS